MFTLIIFGMLIIFISSLKKEICIKNNENFYKLKILFEKYNQLKYLENKDFSVQDKLRLIEKSSFLNSTYKYNSNLFKNLDLDF